MASISLTTEGLEGLLGKLNPAHVPGAVRAGLRAAALQMEIEAKDTATSIIYSKPEVGYKRTGLYRASLGAGHPQHLSKQGPDSVTFGTRVFYGRYLEDGTRPHVIRAKKPGGYLRFVRGGVVYYRRSVNHPGTAARKVLRTAVKNGQNRIRERFRAAVMEHAKKWA